MCGLIAIHDREGVDPMSLVRALDALRHRGPDGRGTWISADRRAGIGHARLSVIDLSGGAQPIASEDSDVVAAVNGELYGYAELRAELIARGHRFRTGSDSEILIHLYQEHGVECLKHLRGEFAFVLWDAPRRRLFAARDRFGIKPLFYARIAGRTLIASEAAALFAAGVEAKWDRDSFFCAAHLTYTAPDRTLFAGVRALEAGHHLLLEDDRFTVRRWWDLDFTREEARPLRDDAEWIRDVRERLEDAVRTRLIADVPVAFQLSGGLDSSAVAAIGAPPGAHCFTIGFEHADYDELPLARETAAALGAVLHAVPASQRDLIEALPRAVIAAESLVFNAHVAAKMLLARAVREAGFKVILSGEGADEVFAGYPHFQLDLDPSARASLSAANRVATGLLLPAGEALDTSAVRQLLGFVPGFLQAKAALGSKNRALLDRGFLDEFAGRDVYRELIERTDRDQLDGRHPVHQSSYLWSKLALPNYVLRAVGDGAEMVHSIEARLPYLDHRLFEVARSLPVELKIRDGVEKHVLREAVRDHITPAVHRRRKHPFFAPPIDGAIGELLHSEAFRAVPFYDHDAVLALFERVRAGDLDAARANDPVLMMAASAAILQQHFLG